MQQLDANLPFDHILPILARSFEASDALERAILGEAQFDGRMQAAGVLEEDDDDDFVDVHRFREELARLSWATISFIDSALLKRVAKGDPGLTCALAIRIARAGMSTQSEEDRKEMTEDALLLLGEAAQGGDGRAQWILGERYTRMKGGLEEGVRLLGQAAVNGLDRATIRLQELFERRYVFIHNASEEKWLMRFAQAGVAEAQFDLASELYLQGQAKNAFMWMSKAAVGGHSKAQERLAFFYELGEGCERDHQKAAHWRGKRTTTQTANLLEPTSREVVSDSRQDSEAAEMEEPPVALVTQSAQESLREHLPSVLDDEVSPEPEPSTQVTLETGSDRSVEKRILPHTADADGGVKMRESVGFGGLLRKITAKLFRRKGSD